MEKINIDECKQRAELSLIISLPHTIEDICKPGRLKNLVQQLHDETIKVYDSKFTKATPEELKIVEKGYDRFNSFVLWDDKPRHILTYISAISSFIENRNYEKINSLIREVVDYYERAGKAPVACFWSAADAEKYWNESFE